MKRRILNEYAAVRNNDKAYGLGKIIYMDLLRAYKEIDFTSRVTKPFQKKYFLELTPSVNVPIIVNYPKKDTNTSSFKHKGYIEINVDRPWEQNLFFEVYFHEVTHAMDYYIFNVIKNKKRGHHFGSDFIKKQEVQNGFVIIRMGNANNIKGLNTVNNILYRLWDTSERNAYQLNALLGETYCNQYIVKLKNDIEYLAKIPSKETIWRRLLNTKEIIRPERANLSTKSFKNFFIKKSYYLLDLFSNKMFKNVKYFNEHQIENLALPNETTQTENGDYPKSKTMEIILYFPNGSIRLIQTRSINVLNEIKEHALNGDYSKAILSNDKNLVDFLISHKYKQVFIKYKYSYDITNCSWVEDIESKFHFTKIYPMSDEERQSIMNNNQQQDILLQEGKKKIILFLKNEQNKKQFINEYYNLLVEYLDYKDDEDGWGNTINFIKSFKKKICGINVVVKNTKRSPYIDFDKAKNLAFIVFDANYDFGQNTLDDFEWFLHVGQYESDENYDHYKENVLYEIEREIDYLLNRYRFN